MKKFMEEFKAFALKGNVVDMAIGVMVAGAFSSLVTAFTDDIINPLIGLLFSLDFSEVVIRIGSVDLLIGSFVSAVINFFLLALVLFFMMKAFKKLEKPAAPAAPVKSDETKALEKIIALLEEQKEAH
jgi:large conductance mechanosensitive channel